MQQKNRSLIIECSFCEARVAADVKAEHEWQWPNEAPYKLALVVCPECGGGLIGGMELIPIVEEPIWSNPDRLWPRPEERLDWHLPNKVRHSLEEARRCYKGKAFDACAVMCRRALEAVCKEFGADQMLAGGLRELRDKQIIDERIFRWGELLRERGNVGAHAGTEKIAPEDARDLLEFGIAITEYVFTLARKFEDFMKRKLVRDKAKKK